jgi:hypothetical protein
VPHLIRFGDVPPRHLDDGRLPVPLGDDQAFGGEATQRFADGCSADLKLRCQADFVQLLATRKSSCDKGFDNLLMHQIAQRHARFQALELDHVTHMVRAFCNSTEHLHTVYTTER